MDSTIASLEPAQMPLLMAELCYFGIPRDAWARTLLRARQLGARSVATAVRWRWHAPTPEQIDLTGISDPQRDLLAFVGLCSRLNIALVLDFASVTGEVMPADELPAWLAALPLSEHERGVDAPRQASERLQAARHWIGACSQMLLASQAPNGPIMAIWHSDGSQLDDWLRQEGWTVPITRPTPAPNARADTPASTWVGDFGSVARLTARSAHDLTNLTAPPLLRADGSARPSFWRAKSTRMLIGAAAPDFAAARTPADLALLVHADIAPLAQRLTTAGIAFDQLAPDALKPAQIAHYLLVIAPASIADQPAVWPLFANCTNLALVGEQLGNQGRATLLAHDVGDDAISELIEARGGHARYAWADNPALEVQVRYGPEYTYVIAHNQQEAGYNGLLAFRAPGGDVLHLHIGLGAGRAGIVLLREDEVVGVAIDGDGAEGGWLARGLTSSIVFNAGAGGVTPYGGALLATAPQSGRFQIRRSAGWEAMRAFRLTLGGELIDARVQIDATHALLPYTAEDERGQTDMYLVLPSEHSLPSELRDYLATLLRARAIDLEAAARLAGQIGAAAGPALEQAARVLAEGAEQLSTPASYAESWRQAGELIGSAVSGLRDDLARTSAPTHDVARIVELTGGAA